METERIELRRERDFGQVFNAAFAYLKQEIKPLGRALLTIVLPGLIVLGIFLGYMNSFMQNLYRNPGFARDYSMLGKFFGIFGIYFLLVILIQSLLITTVIAYLKVYLNKKESPYVHEVFSETLKNIIPVIGASLLGAIVIGIGFVFCILPSIYLGVSLSLFLIALVIERNGIGNAFSRSFQLTHIQWWPTFLIIVVSVVIFYVFYIILEIPAYIMGINAVFLNLKQYQGTGMPILSNTYIIYQSVVIIITQMIYPIPLLILSFHYFNLVEVREKPSLIEKIETLGK